MFKYFRGIYKVKKVIFVNPRNKLEVYDGPYVQCNLKGQYARNKFYGKVYCRYIIRNQPSDIKLFESHKKKDDLADSFLQGVWFLCKNKIKQSSGKTKINYENNWNRFKKSSNEMDLLLSLSSICIAFLLRRNKAS